VKTVRHFWLCILSQMLFMLELDSIMRECFGELRRGITLKLTTQLEDLKYAFENKNHKNIGKEKSALNFTQVQCLVEVVK
jgi:hypothetical protein